MIKMQIRFDAPDFSALSARELARIHKAAGEEVIAWFLRERLPKRFDGSMAAQLGWRDRSPRYEAHKLRARRGVTPMYFTGKTKALFARAVARVTPKFIGFRVAGLGPQFTRFSGTWAGSKNGVGIRRTAPTRRIDLRAEITRLTNPEVIEIGRRYSNAFTRLCHEALKQNRRHLTIG